MQQMQMLQQQQQRRQMPPPQQRPPMQMLQQQHVRHAYQPQRLWTGADRERERERDRDGRGMPRGPPPPQTAAQTAGPPWNTAPWRGGGGGRDDRPRPPGWQAPAAQAPSGALADLGRLPFKVESVTPESSPEPEDGPRESEHTSPPGRERSRLLPTPPKGAATTYAPLGASLIANLEDKFDGTPDVPACPRRPSLAKRHTLRACTCGSNQPDLQIPALSHSHLGRRGGRPPRGRAAEPVVAARQGQGIHRVGAGHGHPGPSTRRVGTESTARRSPLHAHTPRTDVGALAMGRIRIHLQLPTREEILRGIQKLEQEILKTERRLELVRTRKRESTEACVRHEPARGGRPGADAT